ncbi:hypothetical protein D6D21_08324 [Aureobasidium pullulans]|uniref:Uncharacterized protein n=1 Tax=Aureobasidium pullulans TaxID=5580 RepID=A0AB74INT8_AURPU|nr:hypothetical protein D6D21_08324 [Aureobasidium pullulans]
MSAFSFTDLRFPIWKAKRDSQAPVSKDALFPLLPTRKTQLHLPPTSRAPKSVQLSKSSHHAHAIPGQTMATHGQDSQSIAPSDRPTVQNNSLLDTLLERRIDKRMTAYSNKFSASGIISDPTDVDTDVWTQRIFYRATCDQPPQRPLTHALSC